MPGKPRLLPNLPPIGLRDVDSCCLVCEAELDATALQHPLRLQLTWQGEALTPLVIGYSCQPCRETRKKEVKQAHFLAAQKYMHLSHPDN